MRSARPRRLPPDSVLGYPVGSDRRLPRWDKIRLYFERLAGVSPRVRAITLGASTEGRPLLLVVIAAPETLARLDQHEAHQVGLVEPSGVAVAEADQTGRKAIVLVTGGIHPTEVSGPLMTMALADELTARDDDEALRLLDETILLLVPSLNPDGHDLVADWYQRTLGTAWEGTPPPGLDHPYAGHDLNRDWFMLTQAETRLIVERVHNRWRPHIVYDLHEMGPDGPRLVLPPYIDPIDPNVDPILQQALAALSLEMAAELTAAGKTGVATNVFFDAYSPARVYQHYHGGVRILSEAAGARIATPVTRRAEELRDGPGFQARQPTWNHPAPWPGGAWRLRDIIEYEKIAALACLAHAARYRARWVRWQATVLRLAAERARGGPHAFLVPPSQRDPGVASELLTILRRGDVRVEEAERGFTAEGVTYPMGTVIVRLGQPFGAYARTLLEARRYPDQRLYPGGAPLPPYDVTAHALPAMMGVEVIPVAHPFEARVRPWVAPSFPAAVLLPGEARHGLAIEALTNDSACLVNRLLAADVPVYRLVAGQPGRREIAAGAWLVPGPAAAQVVAASAGLAVTVRDLAEPPTGQIVRQRMPRLGLYRAWRPDAADEGWTRLVLERFAFSYTGLRDGDVRQGRLRDRLDVIVLPSQSVFDLATGLRNGDSPPGYTGGLGPHGFDCLRAFIHDGGVLIALGRACEAAISYLSLPVGEPLQRLRPEEFYCPGSLVRIVVDPDHPLGFGLRRNETVMLWHGMAFDVRDGQVAARYATGDPLVSGWLIGGHHLSDRAAMAEVSLGAGRVILIGPRVQFRAQTLGAFRFLFNALFLAGARPEAWPGS